MSTSLEVAHKYKWSSVIGYLHPERLAHLDRFLVGGSVLDAGCGGGGYVEFLARKRLRVVGLDRDQELLTARGNEPRAGRYVRASVDWLPFGDKVFDSTYCFDVLEHVDDERAIAELARVTRKRLILAVPKTDETFTGFGLTFFHYQDRTHLRYYTDRTLHALASTVTARHINVFPELAVPMKHVVRAALKGADASSLPRKLSHRLLARLTDQLPYRDIHTGLVAVVDL